MPDFRKITFIPHTADIMIKVEANTLPGLFSVALEGMNRILKEGFCGETFQPQLEREIRVESVDTTVLLIDFLSEVLTQGFTDNAIYCKVEFDSLEETSLSARILGAAIDRYDEDVKAVTYHEAEVVGNEEGNLESLVLFDI